MLIVYFVVKVLRKVNRLDARMKNLDCGKNHRKKSEEIHSFHVDRLPPFSYM